MSLFILIVLVTLSRNREYTFCRASKDQSGSLITVPYFSSRIPNSRSRRNCIGDIRTSVSLFCGLSRTYRIYHTLQSSHIFSNTVHKFFFNVCRMGTCCTRIYCTNVLYNSCTTCRLAYQKNQFHAL